MRRLSVIERAFLVFFVIAYSPCSLSTPMELYSTFGPDDYYSAKGSTNGFSADIGLGRYVEEQHYVANGFNVQGSFSNVLFTEMQIAMFNPRNNYGGNFVTITLNEDREGVPGAILESFVLELAPKLSYEMYTLSSVLQPRLLQNANYWVVAESIDPYSELGWLWNGIASWGTNTGPSIRYRTTNALWTDSSRYGQQAFRVKADVVAIPAPDTFALVLLAFLSFFLLKPYMMKRKPLGRTFSLS